ncbi:hypothetical protein TI04_03730 [Achromatium sp. WMS2]|nr:hypothetical protein TI04_03730 [Achromatium sp. WMS2]
MLKVHHAAALPHGEDGSGVEAGSRGFTPFDGTASLFQTAECNPAAKDQLVTAPEQQADTDEGQQPVSKAKQKPAEYKPADMNRQRDLTHFFCEFLVMRAYKHHSPHQCFKGLSLKSCMYVI